MISNLFLCNTSVFGNRSLQTQSLKNAYVSSNTRLQTQPLSLVANGMLQFQHYSLSVSDNNNFKTSHYHTSVFGNNRLQTSITTIPLFLVAKSSILAPLSSGSNRLKTLHGHNSVLTVQCSELCSQWYALCSVSSHTVMLAMYLFCSVLDDNNAFAFGM